MLEISADECGAERAGGIHRSAADRAGEHGFESYDGTDRDRGGDAFFLRAVGYAENGQHEDGGEDDLQEKALRCGAGGEGHAKGL